MILAEIPAYVTGLLVALFVVVSVMLMLVVLIQRPQGGGLSEAFGSASGSGHTAFGAKTGDALTTATILFFLIFIGFAIGLNYIVGPPGGGQPAAEITAPEEETATPQQPGATQTTQPEGAEGGEEQPPAAQGESPDAAEDDAAGQGAEEATQPAGDGDGADAESGEDQHAPTSE